MIYFRIDGIKQTLVWIPYHVGVVDGLDLVHVIVLDPGVERFVDRVEEIEELQGCAVPRDVLEAVNLGEADGGRLKHLRGVSVQTRLAMFDVEATSIIMVILVNKHAEKVNK